MEIRQKRPFTERVLYYPLDCKAMGSFLLHLQNNRCKDSNVLEAEHKGYSVTGS